MSETQGQYREYETIFIMRPDSTDQAVEQVRSRIDGVMEKLQGRILKFDNWGKRKLAFSIRDRAGQRQHAKGLYTYMRFVGTSDLVPEIERNMRMLEPVLRYMTIKLDADVDPNTVEERLVAAEARAAAAAAQAREIHNNDDDDDEDDD